MPIRQYIGELQDAGLGSIPGTSAEILDDSIRKRLAGGRITTKEWVDVIVTAHELGIPTTSTVMFGHVETARHLVGHFELLRSIQERTHGFTELVPLSFVHSESPLFNKKLLPDVRPGPTGNDVLRLFAVARLMLGKTFVNIQASWVKEGVREAQRLLSAGANDLGGTLMNESISTSAGAPHGQLVTPAALRKIIRDAGRTPAERTTLYRTRRVYSDDPREDGFEPLDQIAGDAGRFGSYQELTREQRYRFSRRESRA
jgi:FO synthase subunit 2